MKEKPILFSAEMVRAVLAGNKTQTRRVMAVQEFCDRWTKSPGWPEPGECWLPTSRSGKIGLFRKAFYRCPYGSHGTKLWVREAWRLSTTDDCACYEPCRCRAGLPMYRADSDYPDDDGPWRPSIFMPCSLSRITLEVVNVRIERVQDITPADAIAEGIRPAANSQTIDCDTPDPRTEFATLWDNINAKRKDKAGNLLPYSWADSPWVWVVEFRLLA